MHIAQRGTDDCSELVGLAEFEGVVSTGTLSTAILTAASAAFRCPARWRCMVRRRKDTLSRRTGTRKYRPVCWVSAERQTEKDYFTSDVFRDCGKVVRFPKDIHPDWSNPAAVLKRFQKALRTEDFRAGDETWIVVDVDVWGKSELEGLLAWPRKDGRHRVAISNPKFELFLVMHFEKGNGCTTAPSVDAALKRHMPGYDKRLKRGQFSVGQVHTAVVNARAKRIGCVSDIPNPSMTDVFLLVDSLIGDKPE